MKPKISIVIRCRNEYPIILGSIFSYTEDLEHSGYPYEIIIASNLSEDNGPEVLEDRFRRWVRQKLLKIVRYNDKESTWCAGNAGIEASSGDLIVISDAHVSIKTGTMDLLAKGCNEHGGIWHPAINKWGDTDQIRTYGYDLKLVSKFWGDPCLYLPEGMKNKDGTMIPHKIPLGCACCFMVPREEIDKFGAYNNHFGIYGGGEPYLCLKWWILGSSVWCHPEALCRHSFGWRGRWEEVKKPKKAARAIFRGDGKITHELRKGDKYLAYRKGYERPDVQMYRNFMLAAFVLGGDKWLSHIAKQFSNKLPRHAKEIAKTKEQIRIDGKEDREFIDKNKKYSLDDLLKNQPWISCSRHKKEDYNAVC